MVARRVLPALAAFLVAGAVTAAASPDPREVIPKPLSTLKLLQFNVLFGATGGRAAAVAAVIKASGADVVTLDEVNYKDIFKQIARSTGFHAYYVPGIDGYSVGILSRYPIPRCFRYIKAPMRHGGYGCRIPINGTNWWVFGTHLFGFDEVVRSQETALLMSQMKLHANDPVVLAGDLNSQTPGENEQKTLIVIPKLTDAGYTDSFRELYTVQQDAGMTITPPPYGSWERRIDYVFHNAKARAISARVISSVQGYTWPSDHAALAVTLVNRSPSPPPPAA